MILIRDAVADFTAHPLPILFLDTCVLLDVARAAARQGGFNTAISAFELLTNIQQSNRRVYIVVTDVVHSEWNANIPATRRECEAVGQNYITINDLIPELGILPGFTPAVVTAGSDILTLPSRLADYLQKLSSDLLTAATCLSRDGDCLSRALDRFLPKPPRLPARAKAEGKGAKDCIILEHALELSRQLGPAYPQPRYFVSSNTGDFAEGSTSALHSTLVSDFTAANLEYSASLADSIALLRTRGAIP